jgi:hypothetical protein
VRWTTIERRIRGTTGRQEMALVRLWNACRIDAVKVSGRTLLSSSGSPPIGSPRTPVRQWPASVPGQDRTPWTRRRQPDTRYGADLDVLDAVERLFTFSCSFTHQRSGVQFPPRPPMFIQVSAIQRSNWVWQVNPRCAKSVSARFVHPLDPSRTVAVSGFSRALWLARVLASYLARVGIQSRQRSPSAFAAVATFTTRRRLRFLTGVKW